ncbi:hypothetical protein [Halorubrum sp. PV6]|uniref:DUF7096 domain-containing protein n=1 Tax=Halorubrum sp. PV6 TaxID=634157 RepID=UPI000F852EA8|nr:hypothetical protein [Halorubrum sp. PV6]AZQ14068.1 hypothetical protein DOS48_04065 [Halorubrum sp. PV6]
MNRGTALVVAVVVVVGVAGIAAAGPIGIAAAQDDPVETNETEASSDGTGTANETDEISPGERLSGVIGVQRAEISGEVEARAFEVGLNRTETPEERAALVADRLNRTEERLEAIEREQRSLRERREAGELSHGQFAARMAETSARAEAVKREANRSAAVARDLPEAAREARGINVSRLDTLRERAGEASGPEVAAIARGVAGNGVGGPLAADRRGPPEDRGVGQGARNGSDADRPGRGDGPGANRSDTGGGPPGEGDARGGPPDGANRMGGGGDAANGSNTPANGSDDAPSGPATNGSDSTGSGSGPTGSGSGSAGEGGAGSPTERSDGDRGNGTGADANRNGSGGSDEARGGDGGAGSGNGGAGTGGAGTGNGGTTGAASAVTSVGSDLAERLDRRMTDGARLLQRVVGVGGIDG